MVSGVMLEVVCSREYVIFFFQAEDGIRDYKVTGVQTCALPICTKLVQAWESDRRTPEGPALLLVRLVEQNPALVLSPWTLVKRGRQRAKRDPKIGRAHV